MTKLYSMFCYKIFLYKNTLAIIIMLLCLSASDKILDTQRLYIQLRDKSKVSFDVEMADTPYKRTKGLMHRNYIPDNRGMLFIFDRQEVVNFWMKNTYIPLDILFITDKGVITKIVKDTVPFSLEHISSDVNIVAALEINARQADEFSIKENDMVIHSYFNNINLLNE